MLLKVSPPQVFLLCARNLGEWLLSVTFHGVLHSLSISARQLVIPLPVTLQLCA